ncbi:hypothetical protein [Maridesulfovibrio sp. FT414]|uniref:hypothetical protein n=1 Tax=Maridesulfovibrio sp. FT414 TaxID=2979469 RepID=UPI003D8071E0
MLNKKFMFKCPVCGNEYQHGPQIYEGRTCSGYDIEVCETCYDCNWDSWNSEAEETLLAILEEKGTEPPERNDKGFLPRNF